MCPNCTGIVDLNIVSPTTWEFVPGYPFLISQEDFYKDKTFDDYAKSILIAYSNKEISYKELKSFIEYGFYKEIPVKTICPNCNTTFDTLRLCYYGTISEQYYIVIENYFLQAFNDKYFANGSFLYDNNEEIPNLINSFFKKSDKTLKPLYRLISIHQDIPCEKGGEPEWLKYAIETVALSVFGNFLYQLFLQDKTERLKEYIKAKSDNYKKTLQDKKILKYLKKYIQDEHLEWNEEKAIELVKDGLDNFIGKYIDSLT